MDPRSLTQFRESRFFLCLAVFLLSIFIGVPCTFAQTHVANPFAGASAYLNPNYTQEVEAVRATTSDPTTKAKMGVVETYPTAVWMDHIAAIAGDGGRLGLAAHLDTALAQQTAKGGGPMTAIFVIYDLPQRDCAALASNGELSIAATAGPPQNGQDGLTTYMHQYIDAITTIFSNPKYAGIRIVTIVEPDSLPNLVTNAGLTASIQACITAKSSGVYVAGIQYALSHLHAIPNVYTYLDIGHSGWLGWPNNFSMAVSMYTSVVQGSGSLNNVDGFITNTANDIPTHEPFMTATQVLASGGQPINSGTFYSFDPHIEEATYAQALYNAFVAANFSPNLGMIIDTSRNGWGGPQRPTGPGTSTVIDTFVNQSKIDRRAERGLWCNPMGAGIGTPPQANPGGFFPQLQAFVWVKPPGESDGTYPGSANQNGAVHADPNCDPTKTNNLAGPALTGAYPDSPPAGAFFPVQFTDLVNLAFPPIPTNSNPNFSLTVSGTSVLQGATASTQVIVAPINNFSGNVALTISGLPTGVTAAFSPATVTGSSGASTLTFTADVAAPPTTTPATVTITGTSGSITNIATISLSVVARPDFTITGPTALTLPVGTNPTATFTIASVGGFTSSVSLSATGLPAGVQANFSPSSVNGSGSVVVNFNAQASTPRGTFNISIVGTSTNPARTHSAPLALTIPGATDFSLSASPASVSVAAGGTATSTVTVTPSGGFTGAVALSVTSTLPTGVTASISATNVVTFTAAATAPATTTPVNVTITGTSTNPALSHTTTISLTVVRAPDFSLSASPTTVSLAPGGSGTSTITVTPIAGFTGAVTLSVTSTLPAGVTASISATNVVTFTAAATATAGTTPVTITGTSGTLSHPVTVSLVISQPDFSLTATPANVSVAAGGTATSTITITDISGFTGAVALSVTSTLPTGVTASISATNVVTFTAAATAPATATPVAVTITGTSGTLSHPVTIMLTVTNVGNTGGVTVTPVVASQSNFFNEEDVKIANTNPLTALTVTIVVQRTTGISFSGEFNTVGGQIAQTNSSTASAVTYTYTLGAGQTLGTGTNWTFAAQSSGTGTAHPTTGDTWTVTYTTGGQNFSQTGHF